MWLIMGVVSTHVTLFPDERIVREMDREMMRLMSIYRSCLPRTTSCARLRREVLRVA
jgi:hypothetical protein